MENKDHLNFDLLSALEEPTKHSLYESLYGQNGESPVFREKAPCQRYNDLFQKVEDIVVNEFMHQKVSRARDLPITSLYAISEMLIYALPNSPELLVEAMRPDYLNYFFPCHLLNVTILSCKIGLEQKLKNDELVELGVAALIHDIGMLLIERQVFFHARALSAKEREIIESHPSVASRFLEKITNEFPWLVKVVSEEHMRENGLGYPTDAKADLHPYSKIIGICDTYEALTHKRHHRLPFHPADAMKTIVRARAKEFCPRLVKDFLEAFSFYPVGSFVILNNEKVAKVISAVPQNPLKPNIRIIGEDSKSLSFIELSKEPNLNIAGIAQDESYQNIGHKSERADVKR